MSAAFEADLCPETGAPRVRMNFPNGWAISILLHTGDKRRTKFALASIAACPTGQWGEGKTELLCHEGFPDDVAHFIAEVSKRGRPA